MLSVIIPVYNEEESLNVFCDELAKEIQKLDKNHEIIFIDDGSTDSSLEILKNIEKTDKQIKIYSFRKNQGKAEALTFGFQKAKGDHIVTLDADLQDRPKEIYKLLEKAKDVGLDEKKAQKIASGEFTLEDFIEQIKGMQKMGPLSSLTSMIPGLSGAKIPKELLDVQEGKMTKWKHMIGSMTPEERRNPELIKQSRAIRIAKGSGTKPEDVKGLIKNYEKIKKMMKMVGGEKGLKRGQFAQVAKQMGLKL